jgi:hypothetical protein
MPERLWASRRAALATLAGVIALMALILIVSPADRVLGSAVKIVYLHVALSRAGAAGFYAAGLAGLAALATGSERLAGWMRAAGWAGLILFVAGFLVSGVAQMASWGGIAWREPRVAGALNLLAAAVAVQVLDGWLRQARAGGLLRALLAAFQLWMALNTPNVLHPGSAISGSSSAAIQLTGAALAGLGLLLGVWIVWQLRVRAAPDPPDPA